MSRFFILKGSTQYCTPELHQRATKEAEAFAALSSSMAPLTVVWDGDALYDNPDNTGSTFAGAVLLIAKASHDPVTYPNLHRLRQADALYMQYTGASTDPWPREGKPPKGTSELTELMGGPGRILHTIEGVDETPESLDLGKRIHECVAKINLATTTAAAPDVFSEWVREFVAPICTTPSTPPGPQWVMDDKGRLDAKSSALMGYLVRGVCVVDKIVDDLGPDAVHICFLRLGLVSLAEREWARRRGLSLSTLF